MNFLPDAELNVLLTSIQPKEGVNTGYLMLPDTITEAAVKAAGHDSLDLQRKRAYPRAHIQVNESFLDFVNRNCIFAIRNAAGFRENYYLELLRNGRLFLKYQSIIGSRHIADLSDQQTEKLINILVQHLGRLDAGGPAVSAGPVATSNAGESQASSLTAELSLLTASGTRIFLPKDRLAQYPAIKRLLEKAGGKYHAKGYFEFEAGLDCEAVLCSLIGGDKVNPKKDFQFFATPRPLGEEVVSACGPMKGKRVFEPHAGDGALADIARERGAEVVVNELWDVNVQKLRDKGYDPLARDFLALSSKETGFFDYVIANPPFSRGIDIDHVLHMQKFLKPEGVISTIMSTTWQTGTQKKHVAFREYLSNHDVDIEQIPAGAFSGAGTNVPTVRLRIRLLQDVVTRVTAPQAAFAF